jgi:sugar O-acyltransferase (sialic acid O-acetyltransferase NeuD family)
LVVADILRLGQKFTIVGMIDDFNQNRYGTKIDGMTVLGGRESLDRLSNDFATHLIFGFGNCEARLNLAALVEAKGFAFANAIHPRATIAHNAKVGPGTMVAAGAVINPGVQIGRNVIVNTCASVDHECLIGEAVHIGPGARLGGLVRIDAAAWIGIGATILDRICIGARSIIGAGSVITKDVPPGVVVYGVPGRVICSVEEQAAKTARRTACP